MAVAERHVWEVGGRQGFPPAGTHHRNIMRGSHTVSLIQSVRYLSHFAIRRIPQIRTRGNIISYIKIIETPIKPTPETLKKKISR